MQISGLVSGHFVEGLFELDADFAVSVLPVGEVGGEEVELLLQLGRFTLGSSSLDLGELQIQDQISAGGPQIGTNTVLKYKMYSTGIYSRFHEFSTRNLFVTSNLFTSGVPKKCSVVR